MSGSRGAPGGGTGNDGQTPDRSPAGPPTGGAPGTGPGGSGPQGRTPEETTRGGTTMTSARPAQGEGYPAQDAQHYHPPQAYPAPPGAAPTVGQQSPQGGGKQARQAVRRPRTGARTIPRTRKARLRVAKADPWSVMKVSFLLSIALGICTIIAVAVLWMVMDAMGVFSTIGETITEATETDTDSGFDLEAFLSLPRVMIFTSVIALIDVVLATALATLGAFMYNLSAGFVGGIEVTLAEDE
ncbi:DUF3566 domain-containing protein [Streptomyces litchfieldiae]|uniref:DUF3566 domain-containing protein n=1 Tax=Streptomyces litchfieldiae TaxID=3075543 RepID=A0ABU2MLZ0_9ACTN|nr:DUF3566 domain-containing protein [Streptomyces sp. DSM 44938]MDT0342134.1 DUF3566 domain-containing protein [Streptomyces sp. DSM 44938]